MRETISSSVAVIGGGPAGLAAALALAQSDLDTVLIDPATDPAADKRTAALMAASVTMLQRLGVWSNCRDGAAPLRVIRIMDDTGRLLRAPTVEFAASELGEEAFGWNIPNADLVEALRAACRISERITLCAARVDSVETAEDGARIALSDGRTVACQLVVGADGRNSPSRRAAGIAADEWSYDQAAIVTSFAHSRPHGFASTEYHRPSGPFTLVPLPGQRSSLVWVEAARKAEAIGTFPKADLAREIERLSHRLLGRVSEIGPVGVIPLAGLTARRFARNRVALVGEAGHVMPPIGAQGLNLGLRDAATIAELAGAAAERGEDVGGGGVMEAYDRARRLDVMSRIGAVDLLNRSLLSGFLPLQAARAAGLVALANAGPLRRFLLREGIAPRIALPRLMKRDEAWSDGR